MKKNFGQGAVLTFNNPRQRTLEEFADICGERDHKWWLGSITVTWFICSTPSVEREISHAECCASFVAGKGQGGNFLACFDLRH